MRLSYTVTKSNMATASVTASPSGRVTFWVILVLWGQLTRVSYGIARELHFKLTCTFICVLLSFKQNDVAFLALAYTPRYNFQSVCSKPSDSTTPSMI